MAFNYEKIPYPLMQNIIILQYLTGSNIAFQYSNKKEARYIIKNLKEQIGLKTYVINDNNETQELTTNLDALITKLDPKGYITIKCPSEYAKDDAKYYKIEFEDFLTFRQMYLEINRTSAISAIEANLDENKNNVIMQKLVSVISWLSIFIATTIIALISCSPRVNNNILISDFVYLLIMSGSMLLLFSSSNINIHNTNFPIVPKKYQVYPNKWLQYYLLFDLAIILIALVDFHVNFYYLLNPQFYVAYSLVYLIYFILAFDITHITIQI